MEAITRIEWTESRRAPHGGAEIFFIIAEWSGEKWEFYERSSWDISWRKVQNTAQLTVEAERRKSELNQYLADKTRQTV